MSVNFLARLRRRRLARPWSLLLAGLAFLAIPASNYILLAVYHGLPLAAWRAALGRLHPYALFLILAPIPIGIGLLLVRRWAWYAFLLYTLLLLLHNLATLLVQPEGYNLAALLATALGAALLIFFARQDISAPYLKTYPRGWRYQRRKPVETAVRLDDRPLRTRDLSLTGLYCDWPNCPLETNQSVQIVLSLDQGQIELEGGVVRIDENGVGIAFRRSDGDSRQRLKAFLDEH